MSPEPYSEFYIQPENQDGSNVELEKVDERTQNATAQIQKEPNNDTNHFNTTPPKSRTARIALKHISLPQVVPLSSSAPSAAISTALPMPASSPNIAAAASLPIARK
jgi:hypothetical protein